MTLQAIRPCTVYIEIYPEDGRSGDPTNFVRFTADKKLLDSLLRMQAKCIELEHTRIIEAANVEWCSDEDNFSIHGSQVVVTRQSFWFTAKPDYCDYNVQSVSQDISQFIADVHNPRTQGVMILGAPEAGEKGDEKAMDFPIGC